MQRLGEEQRPQWRFPVATSFAETGKTNAETGKNFLECGNSNAQQRGKERGDELFRSPSFTFNPKETLELLAVDVEPEFGRLAPEIFFNESDIVENGITLILRVERKDLAPE